MISATKQLRFLWHVFTDRVPLFSTFVVGLALVLYSHSIYWWAYCAVGWFLPGTWCSTSCMACYFLVSGNPISFYCLKSQPTWGSLLTFLSQLEIPSSNLSGFLSLSLFLCFLLFANNYYCEQQPYEAILCIQCTWNYLIKSLNIDQWL